MVPNNIHDRGAMTKDRAEPIDLLRYVLRSARYQLADEQIVMDRRREEKERRRRIAVQRSEKQKPQVQAE